MRKGKTVWQKFESFTWVFFVHAVQRVCFACGMNGLSLELFGGNTVSLGESIKIVFLKI